MQIGGIYHDSTMFTKWSINTSTKLRGETVNNLECKKNERGIGYVLKLLRIAKDMSIKELASIMKVSSSYICEIESGVKKPSLNMISKYSEALGVSKSTIMYFDERGGSIGYNYQHLLIEILQKITKI